ncbi:Mrp/NBP35 family ATP-binding protein [Opitutia bacterium KCR 482]|nr:Mrp/NBP35 family ATP-binding protein [Opitutae bacterium KCR 482]
MTKEEILNTLKAVKYPPYSKDIVSFGMVKYVKTDGSRAEVRIFTGGEKEAAKKVVLEATKVLEAAYPNAKFDVVLLAEDPAKAQAPAPKNETLAGVKMKIAVASGKGGVGKSTVAVNLAKALAEIFSKGGEARVGLMDCDIHGPSAAILMGEKVFPSVTPDEKIVPPTIDGIKVMSMGMLVDDDQPLIWRGPMVTSAIKQFAEQSEWGELDAMVIDLPPGTGDAVLSVVQIIPLDGALIVSTSNKLAATTAARGAMVFEKSGVRILGVLENMAYFQMPDGSKEYVFGEGFADEAARKLGTEVVARIPIDKSLQSGNPSGASRKIFLELARRISDALKK